MKISGVAIRFEGAVYCITLASKPEHSRLFKRLPNGFTERALEYGFLTDNGRFLNRTEALHVAKESGQVSPDHTSTELISPMLYRQ